MTTIIHKAATAALLATALAVPVAARAASATSASPQSYTLDTRLVERYHAGEYDGRLNITVYPSGIVQGSFRNSDGGVRTVTGGMTGTQIWLDIGMEHPLHLSGRSRTAYRGHREHPRPRYLHVQRDRRAQPLSERVPEHRQLTAAAISGMTVSSMTIYFYRNRPPTDASVRSAPGSFAVG